MLASRFHLLPLLTLMALISSSTAQSTDMEPVQSALPPVPQVTWTTLHLNEGTTLVEPAGVTLDSNNEFKMGNGGTYQFNTKFANDVGLKDPVKCHLSGEYNGEDSDDVFQFWTGASYLSPCAPINGIVVLCEEPYPSCK